MSKRVHIIITEPSEVIRCGITTLLQRISSLSCEIAEINDISTITSARNIEKPDILIVNPTQLGQFSAAQLRTEIGNENLKIIALQSTFIDESILQNYDQKISIYDSAEKITQKIVEIGDKEQEKEQDGRKELSQREKEIIVCVVKGLTNKQIADSLCLSTHTVIAHRRNISNKLQIHSPSGLTIYAIVNKLVNLADIKNSIDNAATQ